MVSLIAALTSRSLEGIYLVVTSFKCEQCKPLPSDNTSECMHYCERAQRRGMCTCACVVAHCKITLTRI